MAGVLYIFLVFVVVYGTLTRYFIRMPDIRVFFISYWLMGTGFLLVLAHTLNKETHIRVDLLYDKLSPSKKYFFRLMQIIAVTLFILIVLPTAISWAYRSFQVGELDSSMVIIAPPVWWYRWVLVVALVMFIIQGMVEIAYSLRFREDILKKLQAGMRT